MNSCVDVIEPFLAQKRYRRGSARYRANLLLGELEAHGYVVIPRACAAAQIDGSEKTEGPQE